MTIHTSFFIVENIWAKNIIHLRELVREYGIYEFVEGLAIRGFDPEGIFIAHLNFVGYSNVTEILVPREIEGNDGIPEIVITSNAKKLEPKKL